MDRCLRAADLAAAEGRRAVVGSPRYQERGNDPQEGRPLVGRVHREALPIGLRPEIREESCGILVEMKHRLRLEIEHAARLLLQPAVPTYLREQWFQPVERVRRRVLHAAAFAFSACATLDAGSRPSAVQIARPALAMASRSTPCSTPRPFIR